MLALNNEDIKNVVIFVSDSLRWDHLLDEIAKMGKVYKTISSSLYTASSFPSIISGLYPPRHRVFNWNDIIEKKHKGFFNNSDINTSLWCETTWTKMGPDNSDIHRILRIKNGTSLEKIETPFVYLEDDKGGHCPYGFPFEKYTGGCKEFFKEFYKKENRELKKQYRLGIEESAKNFKKRIDTLKKRDILDETLIIFTSDHGELLGEYGGLIGHGRPPCPELVYVPTVFIHKSIKPETEKKYVIRHVDLYPTIAEILGFRTDFDIDGKSLMSNEPKTGLNFRSGNFLKAKGVNKYFIYNCESIWDRKGGYVYHTLNRAKSVPFFTYRILSKHPRSLCM